MSVSGPKNNGKISGILRNNAGHPTITLLKICNTEKNTEEIIINPLIRSSINVTDPVIREKFFNTSNKINIPIVNFPIIIETLAQHVQKDNENPVFFTY